MLKKLSLTFLLIFSIVSLTACIQESNPDPGFVFVKADSSQEFSVVAEGSVKWILDGKVVGDGLTYTFDQAEKDSKHLLIAVESNGIEGLNGLKYKLGKASPKNLHAKDDNEVIDHLIKCEADGSQNIITDEEGDQESPGRPDKGDGNPAHSGIKGISDFRAWRIFVVEGCEPCNSDTATETTTDSDTQTETDSATETQTDTVTDSETDTTTETITDTATESETDTITETTTDSATETQTETVTDSETDTTTETTTATGSDSDLQPPQNVSATDLESGQTDVSITWDASAGATSYNVYRAIWEEDAEYELVAENVTETTFTFVQEWQADAYELTGPVPAMAPDADIAGREAFTNQLKAYREKVIPILMNYKCPAYFKVAACNDSGCSELSAADVGQPELIHTAEFSEVAELVVPTWGFGMLVTLADSPPGAQALQWCGTDVCGAGGGIVMGRLDQSGLPMVDVTYQDYVEAWDLHPNAKVTVNGWLGGQQQLMDAMSGIINVSGEFDINLLPGVDTHIFMYSHIGGTVDDNTGYVTVTYKGQVYQFSLPVQPAAGQTYGPPLTPVTMDDAAHTVASRETADPVPFSQSPPEEGCMTLVDDPANIVCQ